MNPDNWVTVSTNKVTITEVLLEKKPHENRASTCTFLTRVKDMRSTTGNIDDCVW